jgi:hypothetical protein
MADAINGPPTTHSAWSPANNDQAEPQEQLQGANDQVKPQEGAAGAALATYKELMDMAMTDGVLGAGDSKRLATARAKHGVTEAQHDALLAELTSQGAIDQENQGEASDRIGVRKLSLYDAAKKSKKGKLRCFQHRITTSHNF